MENQPFYPSVSQASLEYLRKNCLLVQEVERWGEDREQAIHSPQCVQQLKPGAQNSTQVFHVGGRHPIQSLDLASLMPSSYLQKPGVRSQCMRLLWDVSIFRAKLNFPLPEAPSKV